MGKHNEDSYAQHHNGFRPDALFWTHGRGSDVMQPMAIPSVGGMVVSLFITIFIAPCLFCAVEEWKWKRAQRLAEQGDAS